MLMVMLIAMGNLSVPTQWQLVTSFLYRSIYYPINSNPSDYSKVRLPTNQTESIFFFLKKKKKIIRLSLLDFKSLQLWASMF
jgi:hypothetical protein